MTFLLVILVLICLWGIELPRYQDDFLSIKSSTAIKGVFAFLILFSHARGYLTLSGSWINSIYCAFQDHLGQLIVAMFFFYSGFGIWESFRSKKGYEQSFFRKRILKILLHFDIAIAFYVLVQLLIPITYSPRQYLFCWIGWEDVGNSNWFVFVILCLYLIALISMYLQRRLHRGGIIASIVLSAALWVSLRIVAEKDSWWVDTIAAFPMGMIASTQKDQLLLLLRRNRIPYLLTIALLILFIFVHKTIGTDIYGVATCVFCCLIVVISSWAHLGNPILEWAGKNAFTIYIIQRLPMLLCAHLGLGSNPIVFLSISLPVTFLLAEGLSRLYTAIDHRLFASA